jgi:hypothetical protein
LSDFLPSGKYFEFDNLTKEGIKAVYECYESLRKTSEFFGVSRPVIRGYLEDLDSKIIKRSKACREYKVNDQVFSKLNSEDVYYWIGFIVSDGNIYKRESHSYVLKIELNKKDKKHLKKFKKFLDSEHPINCYDNCCQISVSSNEIADDLMQYNMKPRKTKCYEVPDTLEENRHFWRGVIDGDGNIGKYKHHNDKFYSRLTLTNNKSVCKSFKSFCNLLVNVKTSICDKKNSSYSFSINGDKCVPILRFLYKNTNTFLNRKHKKAKNIFGG